MSKKSTIAVTIMACLLAVAVATTIVLAAFSANKTATTTVKFSNGVQIRIDGAYTPTTGVADVISRQATLLWACTEDDGTANGRQNTTASRIENVSTDVDFQAITFYNGDATQSDPAWLIARASIGAGPSGTLTANQLDAIDITLNTTDWTAIGSTGWYAYTASSGGTATTIDGSSYSLATLAVSGNVPFVTAASIAVANMTTPDINELASAQYVAEVQVFAVNAGAADASTVLSSIVNPGP